MEFDKTTRHLDEPHSGEYLDELFKNYREITKWAFLDEAVAHSYYLQYATISRLLERQTTRRILEVGPGAGFTGNALRFAGFDYVSLDGIRENNPTIHCDVREFRGDDHRAAFDLVCAFQILEHIPYDAALKVLEQFRIASKEFVFIGLPDRCARLEVRVSITRSGKPGGWLSRLLGRGFGFSRIFRWRRAPKRRYREAFVEAYPFAVHHWELGTGGMTEQTFIRDAGTMGLKLHSHFHNPIHPYHHFFVFKTMGP